MGRKTAVMHKAGHCTAEKEIVYYHKSKRVGNSMVFQKIMPKNFTTHSFDEAMEQKKDDYKHARNDNINRGRDGVNIGGNFHK